MTIAKQARASAPLFGDISPTPVEGFSICLMKPEDIGLLSDIATGRVVPNTDSAKQGGRIALTVHEMNEWRGVIAKVDDMPVPLVVDQTSARPVFVAIFDGTWNDRDEKDEPMTVPGHLSRELEALSAAGKGLNIKYYHGVGTRVSWIGRLWQGITGSGTKERAENAFREFKAFASQERIMPHVYAIGFSRGSASARHFLNLVDATLHDAPATDGNMLDHARSFALLFDTVATGQTSKLELAIPETTASAIHFIATKERRLSFPVVSLTSKHAQVYSTQRLEEIELPGVHSDLGGGYGVGLEDISLALARTVLVREGFPLPEQKESSQSKMNMGRHNSDWVGTAAANAILATVRQPGRERIDPSSSTSQQIEPASAESLVHALLERSAREINAKKAELARAQSSSPQGKPHVYDGLSIQLQGRGAEFVLITNCPNSVAFDLRSRWLFLNGRPYTLLTEKAVYDANAGGLLMIIDKKNAADFKPSAQR